MSSPKFEPRIGRTRVPAARYRHNPPPFGQRSKRLVDRGTQTRRAKKVKVTLAKVNLPDMDGED